MTPRRKQRAPMTGPLSGAWASQRRPTTRSANSYRCYHAHYNHKRGGRPVACSHRQLCLYFAHAYPTSTPVVLCIQRDMVCACASISGVAYGVGTGV